MKRTIIMFILVCVSVAYGANRMMRIRLDRRIVAAYNDRRARPKNVGPVTWTEMQIRQDIRDVVLFYEQRLNVPDVNDVAIRP